MYPVRRFVFLFLLLIGSAGASAAEPACRLTVGIQETLDPVFFVETMAPTLAHLRKTMPQCRIASELFAPADIHRAAEKKSIDFFMADSGIFAYEESRVGARDLASRTGPMSKDPSRAVSSAIFVRADRTDMKTLADLKGRSVAAVDPLSFDGWLIAQALISREGFDADTFWGRRIFSDYHDPDVAELVLNGDADVGILKACELESLLRRHSYDPASLRIIRPETGGGLACRRSAPLYPDVVFASLPHVEPVILKRIARALLEQKPSDAGYAWGIAGDFKGVDELYRTLRLGPYSYLRSFNWDVFWEQYRTLILMLIGIVISGIVHIIRVNRLVDVRTAQLREALRRQEALEKEARLSRQKLSQVERAGVVSQMSGMLAHEVLQPVAALINFAGGLRMYTKKTYGDDPTVEHAAFVIREEARRVSEIVERVRAYAKGKSAPRETVRAADVVAAAVRTFEHSTTSENVRLDIRVPAGLVFTVNRLEMELVVFNLMKNGAAAMKDVEGKRLAVSASQENGRIRIEVRDAGPRMTDEAFSRLAEPVTSMKEDGLGLGLSICRAIAEHHGGRLDFRRGETGLTASVIVPAAEGEQHD